jgi:hypothetical protein
MGSTPGTNAFANCLQKESPARRYWTAPPAPYCGWVIGDDGGAVLALARAPMRPLAHPNIPGAHPHHPPPTPPPHRPLASPEPLTSSSGLEARARKRSTVPSVIGAGLLLATTAYADTYNQSVRDLLR